MKNNNKNNNMKFKNGLIQVSDYNEMSNNTIDRYIQAKGDEKARDLIAEHLKHIETCYQADKSTKKGNVGAFLFAMTILILTLVVVVLIIDSIVNKRMFNEKLVYLLIGFVMTEIASIGLYLGFSNRGSKNKE